MHKFELWIACKWFKPISFEWNERIIDERFFSTFTVVVSIQTVNRLKCNIINNTQTEMKSTKEKRGWQSEWAAVCVCVDRQGGYESVMALLKYFMSD